MTPAISVHIVTHNNALVLESCVRSLVAQTYTDFATLLIDNASTDSSLEIAKGFDLETHANSINAGYGAAHNYAINATQSRYILTLNPDVILAPEFLAHMISVMDEALPSVGSAAGLLLRIERPGEAPRRVDSAGLSMSRNRRQRLRLEGADPLLASSEIQTIFGPDGAAAFYRRDMLEDTQVEGEVFDSDFFLHKEDVDLCWRGQLRGWSSIFVPGAVAHHARAFRPGQRKGVPKAVRMRAVCNRYLMLIKNEHRSHFLRDIVPIVSYELAIAAYILTFERESLTGYREVWRLRKGMLRKRAIIQSQRLIDWPELRPWFAGN